MMPRFVSVSPSSADSLAARLVVKLQITDPRYDFLSSYGIGFMDLLPARIGSDKVLDASVAALLAAHGDLGKPEPEPEFWRKYGTTLRALQMSLTAPKRADPFHVLAAIYIIWAIQVGPSFSVLVYAQNHPYRN